MLLVTTSTMEGRKVARYPGLVSGEAIVGAQSMKFCLAQHRDSLMGGRSKEFEARDRKSVV